MTQAFRPARWCASLGAAALLALSSLQAHADAGELRARHEQMREQLRDNQFGRQLAIDSAETRNSLQGDVYAVLDHPFEKVKGALQDPGAWCDIMLLPFNTRACQASGNQLTVRIGRKPDQPVEQAHPLAFAFRNVAADADYLQTRLNAGEGPFGTRDYRISAEAVPLANGKTFIHMRYSYGFGGAGRFAMQAYLATAGANKVGFTTNGVRGAVERNAMRYYLAIEANVAQSKSPDATRLEASLDHWLESIAKFPRQLTEADPEDYRRVKRERFAERRAPSSTVGGRMHGPHAAAGSNVATHR